MKGIRRAAQEWGVISMIGLIAHLVVLCICSASCHEGISPLAATHAVHAAAAETDSGSTCCSQEAPLPDRHIEDCECPGPPPELSALVPASGWDLPIAAHVESPVELLPLRLEDRSLYLPLARVTRAPPPWLETHGARAPPFPLI